MLEKLLGDKYRPDMTAEEINAALAEIDIHAGYVPKATFDKTMSEAAKYKKDLQAKMSEDELARQQALEEAERKDSRIKELERTVSITDYAKKFMANGYDEALATATATALIDGQIDTVIANQATFQKAREKALKAEMLKETPVPPAGGSPKTLSKEDFSKMSLAERMKVRTETPDLYAELTK